MLLLLRSTPPTPPPDLAVDVTPSTTLSWSPRPYLHVDQSDWLPLAQILVRNGVDARRLYEVADANGITDLRRVRPGTRLIIPA